MSLGAPDLYIAGKKIQTAKGDPRPALAGLQLKWGGSSQVDFDPASSMSAQMLARPGAMPDYLDVGATVGVVDPVSARCLFAGTLQPLQAAREPAVAGAHRISFTAASPIAELQKHNMIDMSWPDGETSAQRLARIKAAMPRGWTLDGVAGFDWITLGNQRYQSVRLLDLIERYVRSSVQRYSDTSTYVPGAGLKKRLTITGERYRSATLSGDRPGDGGKWYPNDPARTAGTALLPARAIADEVQWEKTPDDLITALQVSTWGVLLTKDDQYSEEWEWPADWAGENNAAQAAYGIATAKVETMLSPQNLSATMGAVEQLGRQFLDSKTAWRPTTLPLPDSRRLDTAPLLNLLAVDTRTTAAVSVPGITSPAPIRAFVLGGTATWTGTHWTTELTLGRTHSL